ncbi:hypothetical protein L227DRAFT_222239 [Lentinus tigrinus ALCF2SS1-6]|uniref:Uncharacterized protein n=1 Tax=Lentinus tigrinus ALCF2SS1-6 TaxID=1328759 RepID=A0A5C2S490_9APHY|nr:hypothetical protein L227DRAFT_222239 [Lentinus tigrinus ALCF2SS1-6]
MWTSARIFVCFLHPPPAHLLTFQSRGAKKNCTRRAGYRSPVRSFPYVSITAVPAVARHTNIACYHSDWYFVGVCACGPIRPECF